MFKSLATLLVAAVVTATAAAPARAADTTQMIIRVVNLAKQTVQFQGNGNNDFQFSLGPMECYDMLGPAFDSNNFFYLNSLNGSETGYIGLNWETSNSVGVPIVQPMYGSNCCGGARTRWWIMAPGPYCGTSETNPSMSCINGTTNGYPGYWVNDANKDNDWYELTTTGMVQWNQQASPKPTPNYVPLTAVYTGWNETGNQAFSPWITPVFAMSLQCASSAPLPQVNLPSQVAAQNVSSYPSGQAPLSVLQHSLASIQGIGQTNITTVFNCTRGSPVLSNPNCTKYSNNPAGYYAEIMGIFVTEPIHDSIADALEVVVDTASDVLLETIVGAYELGMGIVEGLLEPVDVVAALEKGRLVEADLPAEEEEEDLGMSTEATVGVSVEFGEETEGVLQASAYTEVGVSLEGGGLVYDDVVAAEVGEAEEAALEDTGADIGVDILGDLLLG